MSNNEIVIRLEFSIGIGNWNCFVLSSYSLQMLPGIKQNFFFAFLHFRSNKNVKSFLHRFSWHDNNASKSHFSTFYCCESFFVGVVAWLLSIQFTHRLFVWSSVLYSRTPTSTAHKSMSKFMMMTFYLTSTRLCLLWKYYFRFPYRNENSESISWSLFTYVTFAHRHTHST